MRVSQPFTTISFSMSFALMASTSVALPTDLGRSADPYANAVRYVATVTTGPAPVPYVAVDVATVADAPAVTVDPEDETSEVAFEAVDPATLEFGSEPDAETGEVALAPVDVPTTLDDFAFQASLNSAVIADEALAEEIEDEVVSASNFPDFVDHAAFAFVPEVVTLATPDFAVFTQHAAFDVVPEPSDLEALTLPSEVDGDALTLPNQPVSLASADVRTDFVAPVVAASTELQEDSIDPVLVSQTPSPHAPSANSSRFLNNPDAPFHFVANVVTAVEEEDFITEMVGEDSNLSVREGQDGRLDTIVMSSDVLFAFGKAELEPAAQTSLAAMIDKLPSGSTVEIFGHTDAIGREENNLALGLKRAEAVRGWLLENSEMPGDKIIATGVGETDPIALNVSENGQDDPEGRALNRRVEFAFY